MPNRLAGNARFPAVCVRCETKTAVAKRPGSREKKATISAPSHQPFSSDTARLQRFFDAGSGRMSFGKKALSGDEVSGAGRNTRAIFSAHQAGFLSPGRAAAPWLRDGSGVAERANMAVGTSSGSAPFADFERLRARFV